MVKTIPAGVIATVSNLLAAARSHEQLDRIFVQAGAAGEPPDGPKPTKCRAWLIRTNRERPAQALQILGKILEGVMDEALDGPEWLVKEREGARTRVRTMLESCGLSYAHGGTISVAGNAGTARQLQDLIRAQDLPSLEAEFERATRNADLHPREALSAAAAILEALVAELAREMRLPQPEDRSLRRLWKPVRAGLNVDAKSTPNPDLGKVIGALATMVEGIAGLRDEKPIVQAIGQIATHGSRIEPRHARLAINAAYTLTAFLIETAAAQGMLRRKAIVTQVV